MPHPTVWVNRSAMAGMTDEAERAHSGETGGMLLGWVNSSRSEVVVATIVGPGPDAEHHPTRFVPDADWQQTHLGAAYRRTGGKLTYLGDWHVHPQGGYGMSRRDCRAMARIASTPEARCAHPLMALLARNCADGAYQFGVWSWYPSWMPFHPGHTTELTVREWSPCDNEDFWTTVEG